LTDERVLNDVSGLDRQEHADAQRLSSAVNGFQSRIAGAESQERKDNILLNRETDDDSRLNTEVTALRQQEHLMQGDEIKHRQELATAAQRQQDVMDVQKLHRQAMMKLAKVQFQSVKYLEGVAGKVVQGENDLKMLNQRMHGIETGIVGLEASQKSGSNALARLDAAESHMGQNIFGIEQRSIHDHSALRLEQEAQNHVQKASDSVYHQEEANLKRVDGMEHQMAGGYGASFQRSLPAFQSRMRTLKGDIQVMQADEEATRTHIGAIEHQEQQDSHQIRGDLSHDQAELMRTAKRGAELDRSIHDAERIERGYNESAAEEEHELYEDQHRLTDEDRRAAAMAHEADGMDVDRVKNDVTGVSQKAQTAAQMAQDYYKGVKDATAQEERIHAAEGVTTSDLKDLDKDNTTFTDQIAGLEKEESDFEDITEGGLEKKMHDAEQGITIKMQKLSASATNPDDTITKLSTEQQVKQEEVTAVQDGVKTEEAVIEKVDDKNDESKTMDETLEEHQKRLKDNVDAIEAQAEKAAQNIHILAGGLLVFVLVSAVLHNMWKTKIEDIKKELIKEEIKEEVTS
jgi:hypothetical protein